jgi:anti-sigma B factor antagonist
MSAGDAELVGNPTPDAVETLVRLDVPGLAVVRGRRGKAIVVCADGEVDMTTSSALGQELDAAAESAIDLLVVDLNAVTFFGSSGLAALMACHGRCGGRDIAFRVAATQRAVLRPIQLTGLDQELALYPTVEQALIG